MGDDEMKNEVVAESPTSVLEDEVRFYSSLMAFLSYRYTHFCLCRCAFCT